MSDSEETDQLETATGGVKEETLSPEEENSLLSTLEKLGAKPKTKSPHALREWI